VKVLVPPITLNLDDWGAEWDNTKKEAKLGVQGGGNGLIFNVVFVNNVLPLIHIPPPFVLPKGLKNVQVFPAMPLKRGELGLSASLHNPVLKLVKFK